MNTTTETETLRQWARMKLRKGRTVLITALVGSTVFHTVATLIPNPRSDVALLIHLGGIVFLCVSAALLALPCINATLAWVISSPWFLERYSYETVATFRRWSCRIAGATVGILWTAFRGDTFTNGTLSSAAIGLAAGWVISSDTFFIEFDELLRNIRAARENNSNADPEGRSDAPPNHVEFIDPYEILGCERDAPFEEVRSRYRSLVMRYHPDTLSGKGLHEDFVAFGSAKFRSVQDAFDTISRERGVT